MAESMLGLKRSHRCTEVTSSNAGETVTVMGWVQKSRNKGGIIFVDLRDRSGILQIIFEESDCGAENFAKAEKLRSEFVIAVTGHVEKRAGGVNENLATGDIEVRAESLRVLSESETPPFPIEENSKTKEELRLKYRYLDLRRPDIQRNIMVRSQVAIITRAFLAEEGFFEIETPTLIKSTPEGARDYLVPSRVHPGAFYALPQSPQLYKQLLMCSGYDRYFQLARCYREAAGEYEDGDLLPRSADIHMGLFQIYLRFLLIGLIDTVSISRWKMRVIQQPDSHIFFFGRRHQRIHFLPPRISHKIRMRPGLHTDFPNPTVPYLIQFIKNNFLSLSMHPQEWHDIIAAPASYHFIYAFRIPHTTSLSSV